MTLPFYSTFLAGPLQGRAPHRMNPPAFLEKIVARQDARARLADLPRPVVFTNGVFDVLHCGHATYLAQARQLGGSLVTWFDEDTPLELIRELQPDVLVKGGDYDMDKLAETAVVKAYGGRALAIAFVEGYSTTALVKKIRAGSAGG